MNDDFLFCEQCQLSMITESEQEFYANHNLEVFLCVKCVVNNHYSTMLDERIEYPLYQDDNQPCCDNCGRFTDERQMTYTDDNKFICKLCE